MNHVIELRQSKLPDPKKLPNAGSFFKNPIVSYEQFCLIRKTFANVPHYAQENGMIKVPAAWLIEQSGLKGFNYKAVGVDKYQALVLVNYGKSSGQDLITLAKYVQQQVKQKFDIVITPEVRMITSLGEVSFKALQPDELIGISSHE